MRDVGDFCHCLFFVFNSDSDRQRTAAGLDRQFVRTDGHRDWRDDGDNKIAAVRPERRHGSGACRFDCKRPNSRVLGHARQVYDA